MIKFAVRLWNWVKSLEIFIKSLLGIQGKRWKIARGANGTKNGFPCILEESKVFSKRIRGGPTNRSAYWEGNTMYVFHDRHIEKSGTLVIVWGFELWFK